MKTFYEAFRDRIDPADGSVVLREDGYKAIQADAKLEGLREAAEIAGRDMSGKEKP